MAKAQKSKSKPKSPRTRKATKLLKPKITWRENLIIGLLGLCATCLIIALVFESSFDPQRDAENTITRLANEYYTEYYYPSILGQHLDEPATILEHYTKQGLPTIRLRQLLSQTNDTKAESRIRNQYYSCDTNTTTIRYYPFEPFGPHDYDLKITYTCENFLPD